MDTNLGGTFNTCRAAARGMMRRRGGAIVNVSSIVGVHGNPGQTNYSASKAGIIGFTKALARELGSRGVRANVVAPGYITTRLTTELPEELQNAMLANTPLGRFGDPEDVAGAVTVPLLGRRLVRHRRGAPGRRRIGHVDVDERTQTSRDHRPRGRQPLGNDVETTWENLTAGKSGAAEIAQFDASEYPVHFACELKGFDAVDFIEKKKARRMDRFAQMIVAAAIQARDDSGIDIEGEADRIGGSIATGIGGLKAFQDCYDTLLERGPDRVNPFSIPQIIPNMGAGWVSMYLGTRGPLSSQCTACAASNMAIGEAADAIRLGRADAMLAGGTEAGITRVGIAGFSAMRALSRRNDAPEEASRPFDAGAGRVRDGRGRRRRRPRGARAREGARGEDLR